MVLDSDAIDGEGHDQTNESEKIISGLETASVGNMEEGKGVIEEKRSSLGNSSFLQGLEGLHETPVWIEGDKRMATSKGTGGKTKTRTTKNKVCGVEKQALHVGTRSDGHNM